MLTNENHPGGFIDEHQSIHNQKLHRGNPLKIRQQIASFDDIVLETTLSDLQLNEMPGLKNTEQWKRIANRNFFLSPPCSQQCHQIVLPIVERDNELNKNALTLTNSSSDIKENNKDENASRPSFCFRQYKCLIMGSCILIFLIVAIIVIPIAVVSTRKSDPVATDHYFGSISVQAHFDPLLLLSSSVLSNNYRKEFCSLISRTLIDAKTKYAVFFSACHVNKFRNGSIIADFIISFKRYQNVTRLESFLNRTLVKRDLFGGTIQSISFNKTVSTMDPIVYSNDSDYKIGGGSQRIANLSTTDDLITPNNVDNSTNQQQQIRIAYSSVIQAGLSVNITITTTTHDNVHTNKCIILPIINNSQYSFVLTNDQLISSPRSTHVPLNHVDFTSTRHRLFNLTDENPPLTHVQSSSAATDPPISMDNRPRRSFQHGLNTSEQDDYTNQPSYIDNPTISLTTVSSLSSSLSSFHETDYHRSLASNEPEAFDKKLLSSSKNIAKPQSTNAKMKYFSSLENTLDTTKHLTHSKFSTYKQTKSTANEQQSMPRVVTFSEPFYENHHQPQHNSRFSNDRNPSSNKLAITQRPIVEDRVSSLTKEHRPSTKKKPNSIKHKILSIFRFVR